MNKYILSIIIMVTALSGCLMQSSSNSSDKPKAVFLSVINAVPGWENAELMISVHGYPLPQLRYGAISDKFPFGAGYFPSVSIRSVEDIDSWESIPGIENIDGYESTVVFVGGYENNFKISNRPVPAISGNHCVARVVDALPKTGVVSVNLSDISDVTGIDVITPNLNIGFRGETDYSVINAGERTLVVKNNDAVLLEKTVSCQAGAVYTILLIGNGSAIAPYDALIIEKATVIDTEPDVETEPGVETTPN